MKKIVERRKLKLFPGRGLDGKDIKQRLKNRTLEGQVFGDDAYMVDQKMIEFERASTVERIRLARENAQKIKNAQAVLDEATNERQKREQQQAIERMAQERLAELRKESHLNPNPNG